MALGQGVSSMTIQQQRPSTSRSLARWAWTFVALTPVGAVLALLTFVGTTAWTGADFLAAGAPGGPPVSLVDVLVIVVATGLVGLAAPTLSTIFAVRAVRAGERGANTVQTVAFLLLGISAALYGLLGLVVWGPVLYLSLRQNSRGRV